MDIAEIIKSRVRSIGEKVYVSPNIPADKLKNAIEGIANSSVTKESVVAVLDTTVFGVCDNGVLFSEDAVFYKEIFENVVSVRFSNIGSVEVKGVVAKELIIKDQNGREIGKFDGMQINVKELAVILNTIVAAIKEEAEPAHEEVDNENGDDSLHDVIGFNKVREKLKFHGILWIVIGVCLCCTGCFWWGGAAVIIGLELLFKYNKDLEITSSVPTFVYEADVKELTASIWFQVLIVIGVFGVPEMGKKTLKRILSIEGAIARLRARPLERIIASYSGAFKEKDDPLGRKFVRWYIRKEVERGNLLEVDLEGRKYVFSPECFRTITEKISSMTKNEIRVSRSDLINGIKDSFEADEKNIEAFINLPENEVESYTFADGSYYVHGLNNDKIRVCAACGIAEVVESEEAPGEYFCSDYCRETDALCEKIVKDLRSKKLSEAGIDGAAFGGSLNQVVSSIKYNKGNVAAVSMTGHGVAAENANTRIDKLLGRSASVVGGDNAKDGADRIVNGTSIQSKYCQSATASVNEAFADKGSGNYRYYNSDNTPMQLEVPRDQYPRALEEMRKKILEGKVPGITDPNEAEKLVRKGHLTYKQAQNLCKFGTIESLAYDAYTGVIVGATACGISFVLTTALSYYRTKDLKVSLRAAVSAGIGTGGKAFAVYVLTAQVQRTAFVKAFMNCKALDINFGAHGKFMGRLGKGLDKMAGGNGTHFSKNANVAVKGAVVTAAATLAVTSAWEVGKMCAGKMSGMQCIKNITVSTGGITGGTIGALVLGSLMAPIPGGVFLGGLIGGSIGGMVGTKAAKAGMDALIEDDAVMILGIVNDEFKILAATFCMDEEEIGKATKELDELISSRPNFVEEVYSMKSLRRNHVARLLRQIFVRICMERPFLLASDVTSSSITSAMTDDA